MGSRMLAIAFGVALGRVLRTEAAPAHVQPVQVRQSSPAVRPAGNTTADVVRKAVGYVPYGVGLPSCTVPGKVALTFDDGPWIFTNELLDTLDEYDAKATFFVTGGNFGVSIDDCATGIPDVLKRMHAAGHQIAQHTWTHPDLVTLPAAEFEAQIYWNEMALRNVLGLVPTYARPPYFSCDAECLARFASLGYHVVMADVDTKDYAFNTPETHQTAKDNFVDGLAGKSHGLVLSHDIHRQTVQNLTRFMLGTIRAQGLGTSVTVGECMQDPVENWYRAAGPVIECAADS